MRNANRLLLVAALLVLLFSTSAGAAATSESRRMEFETCKRFTEQSVRDLNLPYDAIVRTRDLWLTKIRLADGAVLITCSRPDRKLVLTKSTP